MTGLTESAYGDLFSWSEHPESWTSDDLTKLTEECGDALLAEELFRSGLRTTTIDWLPQKTAYVDNVTGLPFVCERERFRLVPELMFRSEHSVIDSRYYRRLLTGPNEVPRTTVTPYFTGGAIDRFLGAYGSGSTEFLSAPIVDFDADSTAECAQILDSITSALTRGSYFKRLWLRGQHSEYIYAREKTLCHTLGYGDDGMRQPSILPTLGRSASAHLGAVEFPYSVMGPFHQWEKPFLIAIMRQNPRWFDECPRFWQRIDDSLGIPDDSPFAQILHDIKFSGFGEAMSDSTDDFYRVSDEADDLRQWFNTDYRSSAFIWVLQQYGYLASVLDLTTDLDTALFFTHATMLDGRFQLLPPEEGRLIYVFAESKGGGAFFDTEGVFWGDRNWTVAVPPRIVAQRCGCLVGSTHRRQNLYGNLPIARIRLQGPKCLTSRSVAEVFPHEDQDVYFRTFMESQPPLQGLY
jgi:hypothetical protein